MNNNESQSDPKDKDTAKEEHYTYDNTPNENKLSQSEEDARAAFAADRDEPAAEDAPEVPAILASEPPTPASPGSKRGSAGWIILSAILAIALVIVLIKPPFGGMKEAVATVNGTTITKDKLYNILVDANGAAALDNLITEELVQQEADAASITITDDDVTDEVDAIKLNFPTDDDFQAALTQNGYTIDSLRENLRLSAMIRKVLEPQTKVTDEDVQKYYDDNKAKFSTPAQVRASHILVATKEEADAIEADLKAGGDFAAIAKEKSTDTASATNGGDLGFFGHDDMVPEFADAAFAMKVGDISDPVKSDYGYHIIKKTDEKAAVEPTFEEKKDAIKVLLVGNATRDLSTEWLQGLKDKAKITNKLTDEDKDAAATEKTDNNAGTNAGANNSTDGNTDAGSSATPAE